MGSISSSITLAMIGGCLLIWALHAWWCISSVPSRTEKTHTEYLESEWYLQAMAELESERREMESEQRRDLEEREQLKAEQELRVAEEQRLIQERLVVEESSAQLVAESLASDLLGKPLASRK